MAPAARAALVASSFLLLLLLLLLQRPQEVGAASRAAAPRARDVQPRPAGVAVAPHGGSASGLRARRSPSPPQLAAGNYELVPVSGESRGCALRRLGVITTAVECLAAAVALNRLPQKQIDVLGFTLATCNNRVFEKGASNPSQIPGAPPGCYARPNGCLQFNPNMESQTNAHSTDHFPICASKCTWQAGLAHTADKEVFVKDCVRGGCVNKKLASRADCEVAVVAEAKHGGEYNAATWHEADQRCFAVQNAVPPFPSTDLAAVAAHALQEAQCKSNEPGCKATTTAAGSSQVAAATSAQSVEAATCLLVNRHEVTGQAYKVATKTNCRGTGTWIKSKNDCNAAKDYLGLGGNMDTINSLTAPYGCYYTLEKTQRGPWTHWNQAGDKLYPLLASMQPGNWSAYVSVCDTREGTHSSLPDAYIFWAILLGCGACIVYCAFVRCKPFLRGMCGPGAAAIDPGVQEDDDDNEPGGAPLAGAEAARTCTEPPAKVEAVGGNEHTLGGQSAAGQADAAITNHERSKASSETTAPPGLTPPVNRGAAATGYQPQQLAGQLTGLQESLDKGEIGQAEYDSSRKALLAGPAGAAFAAPALTRMPSPENGPPRIPKCPTCGGDIALLTNSCSICGIILAGDSTA